MPKFGYRRKSFRRTFARFAIKKRTLSDLADSVFRCRRRRVKEQSAGVVWILDISYVARYLASRHCEFESVVRDSQRASSRIRSDRLQRSDGQSPSANSAHWRLALAASEYFSCRQSSRLNLFCAASRCWLDQLVPLSEVSVVVWIRARLHHCARTR